LANSPQTKVRPYHAEIGGNIGAEESLGKRPISLSPLSPLCLRGVSRNNGIDGTEPDCMHRGNFPERIFSKSIGKIGVLGGAIAAQGLLSLLCPSFDRGSLGAEIGERWNYTPGPSSKAPARPPTRLRPVPGLRCPVARMPRLRAAPAVAKQV
jgi:hypothetical protein